MRVNRKTAGIICLTCLLMAGTGCSAQQETKSTAMVLLYGDGQVLFVDQKNETPYFPTLPEEGIYDKKGNKTELESGNIVTVYGDGIMLESYPGQYPGITRIEVKSQGTPQDAAKYEELIAQIYQEPDPKEPPQGSVEYTTELADVTAALTMGGFEWTVSDEDGEAQTTLACGTHITQWEEINDIRLQKPTDVKIAFDRIPEKISIERFAEEAASDSDGEKVETIEKDGNTLFSAEAGYRYLITAFFTQGEVQYGIAVVQ